MSKRFCAFVLTGLLLLPTLATARDAGFYVLDAQTAMRDGVFVLDAAIELVLSEDPLDALDSGVPLTITLDIDVERKRSWWLDAGVATLEQRYELHYYPLSDQYLVRNLNSGALYAYPSLDSALDALGHIQRLPLLDSKLVQPGEEYEVELRARLDIEALPAPLRPVAYVTPGWHLGSGWYTCSLQP